MQQVKAGEVTQGLESVRRSIEAACRRAERDPLGVTLVAVSKTEDGNAVTQALSAGQRVFGENRVQEAQGKFPPLREAWPNLSLHLIGPLQTNKAEDAVRLFDVIESLDRPKLARSLARVARAEPGERS